MSRAYYFSQATQRNKQTKMAYEYENYDPSFPDQPVVDQYLPVWARLPAFESKPAFIWSHQDSHTFTHLTYKQLNTTVHTISSNLLSSLQTRDTVLLLCSPGLDLVELIFACQRSNLLSVPMTPPNLSLSKQNYHHLIRAISQTKPKAVVAHSHYISNIQHYISSPHNNHKLVHMLKNIQWISIDQLKHRNVLLNSHYDSVTYNGCKANDVYLVQYTSGATGIPKPVLVTAGSAAHNVRTARRAYDLHPNSTIVSWLPQYHDCGLMFLLLTVVSGATCVLTSPTAFIKRPRIWLELMSKFNATCTPVPSFTLPLVIKRGGTHQGTSTINLSNLKNLIIINEPIYRDSVEEFVDTFSAFGLSPSSISPSYGLAENCTFVSTAWRRDNRDNDGLHFPTHKKLLPVARLGNVEEEDVEIMVVNEQTLDPVEDGVEGEIWVFSPSNASGYLGHPSLTREVFHGRLRNRVSKCFLRTGDRGIVKGENRYLFVTGRCQDVIELGNGENVHPHYIESAAFKSCEKLLRGGCVAAFNVSTMVVVVAEIQRMEIEIERGVLKKICEGIKESVWKEEKVEVGWVVLVKSGCVPKTTSGKLQRWKAMEKLVAGEMMIVMEMRFGKDFTVFKRGHNVREEVLEEKANESGSVLCAQIRSSLISLL